MKAAAVALPEVDVTGISAMAESVTRRRVDAVLLAIHERGPLTSDGIAQACADAGAPVTAPRWYPNNLRRCGWLTAERSTMRPFRQWWGLTDKGRKRAEELQRG